MIRATLILSTVLFAYGCAMKIAPTGGPQDTQPARVSSISPPSGSRNLVDPQFIVEFDDYVDRGIRNDISVIPTIRLGSSYAGDEISIWFEETPQPNTTYAITIGTNWKDLRGNSATEATSIVFSTGPDLDSGSISGDVDASNFQNVVVLVFPGADTLGSSFDPRKTIAPYQVPVGSNGAFRVGGLKDGRYRVLVVRDGNRNGLPDHDEEYGIAQRDVDVVKGASESVHLFLGPSVAMLEPDTATTNQNTVHADSIPADSSHDHLSTPADSASGDSVVHVHPGSVEGTFAAEIDTRGVYIARFVSSKGTVGASIRLTAGQPWVVDSIAPGTYVIDVFVDVDDNGVFSHGVLFPFQHSEPRFRTNTSIAVRERWTTEGVHLMLQP